MVTRPKGIITATQLEILETLWARSEDELSVADIWRILSKRRAVARTTVLTLVNRLTKRGWLRRHETSGAARYTATQDKDSVTRWLATRFVEDYFHGSPASMVGSLLGGQKVDSDELLRLRLALEKAEEDKKKKKGKK